MVTVADWIIFAVLCSCLFVSAIMAIIVVGACIANTIEKWKNK